MAIRPKNQHRARRLALQALCCLDAQGERASGLVEAFIADSREEDDILRSARRLCFGAFGEFETTDAVLARHATHWDLPRLAMVDRNILRLAVYEMHQAQTPPKVVITEALHLAREFSTAESPRFINGVLDAVAQEIARQT